MKFAKGKVCLQRMLYERPENTVASGKICPNFPDYSANCRRQFEIAFGFVRPESKLVDRAHRMQRPITLHLTSDSSKEVLATAVVRITTDGSFPMCLLLEYQLPKIGDLIGLRRPASANADSPQTHRAQ